MHRNNKATPHRDPAMHTSAPPGSDCRCIDTRAHVDAQTPGTYARLSYTQRVLAETVLRRAPRDEIATRIQIRNKP